MASPMAHKKNFKSIATMSYEVYLEVDTQVGLIAAVSEVVGSIPTSDKNFLFHFLTNKVP